MIWLLAACSWHTAAPLPAVERLDAFAIEARGSVMAGQALVVTDSEGASLHALTPAGTTLFTVEVHGSDTTVSSASPDLGVWLERLPFARDLAVLYRYECADRCKAGPWKLVVGAEGTKVRGPGGPALLAREEGRFVLHDSLRGYTLTVAKSP